MPKYTTEIEINDDPIEVVVEYEYEPPCGDGWHEPRFAEQVNIYSITDKSGNEIDFINHEQYLTDQILNDLDRQAAEYEADRAEYLYESMLDRRMDL
jgi:hypothetical protein